MKELNMNPDANSYEDIRNNISILSAILPKLKDAGQRAGLVQTFTPKIEAAMIAMERGIMNKRSKVDPLKALQDKTPSKHLNILSNKLQKLQKKASVSQKDTKPANARRVASKAKVKDEAGAGNVAEAEAVPKALAAGTSAGASVIAAENAERSNVINEATDAANSESGVSDQDANTNDGVNDTIAYQDKVLDMEKEGQPSKKKQPANQLKTGTSKIQAAAKQKAKAEAQAVIEAKNKDEEEDL